MTHLLTDDEAAKVLEALVTGREYTAEALSDYIEKYEDHPAAVAGQKIISESLQEILDAIAILDNAQRVEVAGTVVDPTFVQFNQQYPYGTELYAGATQKEQP